MINIADKYNCCGCTACAERCPQQCIAMIEDEEGFQYPKPDENLCIDCGLCEKVCPVINQDQPCKPIKVYATKNPDEKVRLTSSSGGIFTMIAEQTIKNDGIVFGARFDENWEVTHDYAEFLDEIVAFKGSKYVQSNISDNYQKAERFLKEGREVLFTGTPCQIAGLYHFLRKKYNNLTTIDIVCHGVPSPLVWRDYLAHIIRTKGAAGKKTALSSLNDMPVLTNISFRDKSTGWKKYGFVVRAKFVFKADKKKILSSVKDIEQEYVLLHETLDKNMFMQGFLKNIYLRPSCYVCPAKAGKSKSDITIADFWGVGRYYPDFDDDKGCNLVLVNTPKGDAIYQSLTKEDLVVEYKQAFAGNPSIEYSCAEPVQRVEFWRRYASEGIDCIMTIVTMMRPSIFRRCILLIKRFVKSVIVVK